MNRNRVKLGLGMGAAGAALLFSVATQAALVTIYDGEQATFGDDLSAFGAAQDLGIGTTWGVENVAAPTAFGSGDAMRIYDLDAGEKPELQGELASPLLGAFRIDFQSLDQSTGVLDPGAALRFRMGNSGDSITSENRVAFSLSWQADGELTAKHSDPGDGVGDVDTLSSAALVGVQTITLVANGAASGTYSYNLFGGSRTIDPLSYDVYINGTLLNTAFATGLAFHEDKTGSIYNPALGLQRFGIVGSSDADFDPDYQFDNIVLRTGVHIPEPSVLGLLLVAAGVMGVVRRTRG